MIERRLPILLLLLLCMCALTAKEVRSIRLEVDSTLLYAPEGLIDTTVDVLKRELDWRYAFDENGQPLDVHIGPYTFDQSLFEGKTLHYIDLRIGDVAFPLAVLIGTKELFLPLYTLELQQMLRSNMATVVGSPPLMSITDVDEQGYWLLAPLESLKIGSRYWAIDADGKPIGLLGVEQQVLSDNLYLLQVQWRKRPLTSAMGLQKAAGMRAQAALSFSPVPSGFHFRFGTPIVGTQFSFISQLELLGSQNWHNKQGFAFIGIGRRVSLGVLKTPPLQNVSWWEAGQLEVSALLGIGTSLDQKGELFYGALLNVGAFWQASAHLYAGLEASYRFTAEANSSEGMVVKGVTISPIVGVVW